MKTLHCRDLGLDCDQVIRADTEEEILDQAVQHAQTDHNLTVTPEIATQARTLIHDDPPMQSA